MSSHNLGSLNGSVHWIYNQDCNPNPNGCYKYEKKFVTKKEVLWWKGDIWSEKGHKNILKDNMAKVFGEWTKHILKIVMDDVNICNESWEEGDV